MKVGDMVRRIRSLHPFSDEGELVEVGVVIEIADERLKWSPYVQHSGVVVMILWCTGPLWHQQYSLEVLDASR